MGLQEHIQDHVIDATREVLAESFRCEPLRLQDYIIGATREVMEEAFRYARAVPEDKLDWQPMGVGQSVLSMAREMAKCPDWIAEMIGGSGDAECDTNAPANEQMTWSTLDECEAASKGKLERFFRMVRDVPDEQLGETMDLPFGPGGSMQTFTVAQMLEYPRWNANYHLGQIGYIQTLYGEGALH